MRGLLVALVATAALALSQNTAEAVLVKVVVDNFTTPLLPPADTSFGGDTEPLAPPVSDVASMRTLGPAGQLGGLTVPSGGGGDALGIVLSGTTATATYALSSGSFLMTDPLVFLTGVTSLGSSNLTVAMFVDAMLYDTAVYNGLGPATQDLSFHNAALAVGGPYSTISFVFSSDEAFSGSAEDIVANPEPATMALMGLGVLGGAFGYRRRRKDDEVAPVED